MRDFCAKGEKPRIAVCRNCGFIEVRGKALDECFGSSQYRDIMRLRVESVDARAVIVEEDSSNGASR